MPTFILVFLAQFGCYPSPDIEWEPDIDKPAVYREHKIVIRTFDEGVLVHELWHDCQWQKNGRKPVSTYEEWIRWEEEAKRIESIYRQQEM